MCDILCSADSDFFDPDDMIQVKYEMLRQVHVDNLSVSQAAHEFGFSRPSFYQASASFEQAGLVRAGATETRSQKRSQTHAGSDGIRSSKANIGSVAQFRSAGGAREDGFQRSGSPAQHRATASAGKKTSLKSDLALMRLAKGRGTDCRLRRTAAPGIDRACRRRSGGIHSARYAGMDARLLCFRARHRRPKHTLEPKPNQ